MTRRDMTRRDMTRRDKTRRDKTRRDLNARAPRTSEPWTREPQTRDPLLARAAIALYPPSWRARYGNEVLALLHESGGGLRAVASLAWRALPAWIWPPAHLHDRPARMRASLSTGLLSWSFLTGLGLVFAQLTQLQGFRPPGHPVIGLAYLVFDAASAVAAAAMVVAVCGLCRWAKNFAGYHHYTVPGLYLALVAAAAAVTAVSAARGARAARAWSGILPG